MNDNFQKSRLWKGKNKLIIKNLVEDKRWRKQASKIYGKKKSENVIEIRPNITAITANYYHIQPKIGMQSLRWKTISIQIQL